MESMTLFNLAAGFADILHIVYVALGLGLVIFFHELGHFAVAKWCDVYVERFSIGFGPIIWSFKRGETEYAFSAIPFGGYVKMLGQDDIDPSQLSSEEIAQDPRSYSAKSVSQRMAIISAGVIMNIVTGMMFFAIAFQLGVESNPSVAGFVNPGSPAWVAGMTSGDEIATLNGDDISEFVDVMLGVALSSGDVRITGKHPDGSEFDYTITPDESGTRRVLGIGPPRGLRLEIPKDDTFTPTLPGLPAHEADPGFLKGDLILKIDDVEVTSFAQLQKLLADKRESEVVYTVERMDDKSTTTITVQPQAFRRLGLAMDIGPITQIVSGSPAQIAGLEIGDKITKIDGLDVGTAISPLKIPDEMAARADRDVTLEILRQEGSGPPVTQTINIRPVDRPGWIERPYEKNIPLTAPAIGVAYNVIPHIVGVEPDSPAAKAELEVGESIRSCKLLKPVETDPDGTDKDIEIKFEEDSDNWAYAFSMIQSFPEREIELTVGTGSDERTVSFAPDELVPDDEWFLPFRGTRTEAERRVRRADSLGQAVTMGFTRTRSNIIQLYLTLRQLFSGGVSPKELHGPVGIATVAFRAAEQGLAELLLFLGFLSINLAVLNFLPIPVLDGGHMVFLSWEAITGKRPSERILVAATYAGMLFVLSLMAYVLYLDIFVHRLSGE